MRAVGPSLSRICGAREPDVRLGEQPRRRVGQARPAGGPRGRRRGAPGRHRPAARRRRRRPRAPGRARHRATARWRARRTRRPRARRPRPSRPRRSPAARAARARARSAPDRRRPSGRPRRRAARARSRDTPPRWCATPLRYEREAVPGAVQRHPVAGALGIRREAGDAVAGQAGADERRGARPLAGRRCEHPLGGLRPALRAAAAVLGEVIGRGGQRQPRMRGELALAEPRQRLAEPCPATLGQRCGAIDQSIRPAISVSRHAIACWIAASGSPASAYQSAARRCRAGASSGSARVSSARSIDASSGWWRKAPSQRSSGSSGNPARIRLPERRAGAVDVEHRVAQRAAQPREDRGPAQERALGPGQARQQVALQVVRDDPVGAAEGGDRAVGVGRALERPSRRARARRASPRSGRAAGRAGRRPASARPRPASARPRGGSARGRRSRARAAGGGPAAGPAGSSRTAREPSASIAPGGRSRAASRSRRRSPGGDPVGLVEDDHAWHPCARGGLRSRARGGVGIAARPAR